jgi:nitrite reductase (cytochrome c-552)
MGFHEPQEAAMVLGEAADYERQGELAALRWDAGSAAGAKPTPNH